MDPHKTSSHRKYFHGHFNLRQVRSLIIFNLELRSATLYNVLGSIMKCDWIKRPWMLSWFPGSRDGRSKWRRLTFHCICHKQMIQLAHWTWFRSLELEGASNSWGPKQKAWSRAHLSNIHPIFKRNKPHPPHYSDIKESTKNWVMEMNQSFLFVSKIL